VAQLFSLGRFERMSKLLTILKTPIPGLKRRPRLKQAPWVLRHCPENKRHVAVPLFLLVGLVAHIILYVAGIMGIFLIPFFLILQHPHAPIADAFRWLREHFSHDTVFFICIAIWGVIVFGLTYATKVSDYISKHPTGSDETQKPDKSPAA